MKKLITLNKDEIESMARIHKKMMEAIGEKTYQYDEEKTFEIFAISIAITISNMLGTFGVRKNIKLFLDDLVLNILSVHDAVQMNSSYMEFKDGKKVSEGNFQ